MEGPYEPLSEAGFKCDITFFVWMFTKEQMKGNDSITMWRRGGLHKWHNKMIKGPKHSGRNVLGLSPGKEEDLLGCSLNMEGIQNG